MKCLLVHNFYQQPGGEDQVFTDEARLLESRGHQVLRYTVHNDDVAHMGRLRLAARTLWNRQQYRQLRDLMLRERPDIVHFHNTFPLISPAAYYAARSAGVPVVQTLHNFRLVCPNALLLRDRRPCDLCLGRRVAWPSIVHRCYRQDRAATAVTAAMLTTHHALGTWRQAVDVYIALSQFSRDRLVEGGLPAAKIVVKPNFLPAAPPPGQGQGGYAIFVGRLSPEKGIDTLLTAWPLLRGQVPLKIIGDGPLADAVQQAQRQDPSIQWLGRRPPSDVYAMLADAAMMVLPSICYENMPRTILEAFAVGTPVVASRRGAMAELVDHRRTGLLFEPGDPPDLARQVESLMMRPSLLSGVRCEVRREFDAHYTAERNYPMLMAIYDLAAQRSSAGLPAAQPV
jgi:glycosyltransferase involved in cell wall biosynthesis